MFASPRSALGLRRSLVRSKNPGKESPGTGTRPGQTDRHYKCHPSQHKHQELTAQSHVSLFQFTALTHRVSSTAPITARRTRPSSPWRPCWSTPATPDTSRSASPTPSVSSTTPRRSGLGPTSPASVSPWRQQSLTQWWDPLKHFSNNLRRAWGHPRRDSRAEMSDIWLSDLLHLRAWLPAGGADTQILPGGRLLEPTTAARVQTWVKTCYNDLKCSRDSAGLWVVCARYLLFRPWLVSHKYVTLFQRSPVPLPRTRPSVAWCSTRWPTTPWSLTSATTATWSSGRACGAVIGARSGPGSSPSAEVRTETHCCDICRAIPQNIVKLELTSWKLLQLVTMSLSTRYDEANYLDKIRNYTTVCKPNLLDQRQQNTILLTDWMQ